MADQNAGIFQSRLPFEDDRIGAAAVYCSDGRYGEQMDEFLHIKLKLPRYDRVAVPGGAAALASHTTTTREEGALEHQLRFLVDSHKLARVVLIAHQDCGFYKRVRWNAPSLESQQFGDLIKAARRIRGFADGLVVDAYFSRRVDRVVCFEPIDINAEEITRLGASTAAVPAGRR